MCLLSNYKHHQKYYINNALLNSVTLKNKQKNLGYILNVLETNPEDTHIRDKKPQMENGNAVLFDVVLWAKTFANVTNILKSSCAGEPNVIPNSAI